MSAPAYTGTIALFIGLLVTALKAFGVQLPDDFSGQATSTIVAIITAISMAVGIWRLLHSKKVADTLSAQVTATGKAPVAGPDKGAVPSESDVLNAQQIVLAAQRKAQS